MPVSKEDDIDLTSLKPEQILAGIGDMVMGLLGTNRVAVVVQRDDGVISFINPLILQTTSPEELAKCLLESWSEEQIEEFLGHVYG